MVAISLYRGNLHRVPDVPRRWLMPTHNISFRDFKTLLRRRSKALSRLASPNPNPNLDSNATVIGEEPKTNGSAPEVSLGIEGVGIDAERPSDGFKNRKGSDIGDDSDSLRASKSYFPPQSSNPVENGVGHVEDENPPELTNPNTEANKENVLEDKGKRKKEVEDKLKVLNEKKHNLVQVLKQILHVEEELKRRSSVQGIANRSSSAPLQADAAAAEGIEADDLSNHNIHSRPTPRNSSMSPSSESPLRRPAHNQPNVVSHPSRPNFGITSSPSCLPPSGQQAHPPNLPTVSVSGTNYVASSPSPAASGGTSVSREARQPSPWN